jgi:O-antigen/teichoic acid export membrane protein
LALAAIALVLTAFGALVVGVVPWTAVLGVDGQVDDDVVRWSVIAAAAPVLAGMPLTILPQVYAGYQRTYVVSFYNGIAAALTLVGLVLAIQLQASLPALILAFGGAGLLASVVNLAHLSLGPLAWLRPNLRRVSRAAFARLWRSSLPLFLFQLGALGVNQTQQLVLAHQASLATVADYAVVMRVYLVVIGLIAASTSPFLPPLREAYDRGDLAWVRLGFRRLVLIRMGLALAAAAVLVAGGNVLLRLWLNRSDMQYNWPVWLALATLLLATTWVTTYSDFLVIMDRIWAQVALVLANGLMTVLLTLWLVPALGLLGAILAISAMTVTILAWLVPGLARPLLAARV